MEAAQPDLPTLLPSLPRELTEELAKSYSSLQRGASEGRFDRVELAGGKLCETVMRVLEWWASGKVTYTPMNRQLPAFDRLARGFEGSTSLPESLRFHVPQVMLAVYTVRNRRGVSHVGGEVDPNRMDASLVLAASSWMLAELVRLDSLGNPALAQAAIERLTQRRVPLVWQEEGILRVLDHKLSHRLQTLAILYAKYPGKVSEEELVRAIEPESAAIFRRDVLRPAHSRRYLNYDEGARSLLLSPKGLAVIEKELELWSTE